MKGKGKIIITLIALFLFGLISIGYASYGARNTASGLATFTKNGEVYIASAILTDYHNLQNIENPTVDGRTISFSLDFNVARNPESLEEEYSATYTITITNDTFFDYAYTINSFNPHLTIANEEDGQIVYDVEGIETDEIIPSKESKTFHVTVSLIPNQYGDYNVSGDIGIDLEKEEEEGRLLGSIPSGIEGDLTTSNKRIAIPITVINTYPTEKSFSFSIINNNFYLVNNDNNPPGTFTIPGNETQEITIYLRVKDDAQFASSRQKMNLYFTPSGGSHYSMGVVTAQVTVDETLTDVEPPVIENVTGTITTTRGNIEVSYNGSDNVGISHYIIETYKVENNTASLVSSNQTVADETSYTVTGLNDGTYYFKVQAVDTSGLTATSQSEERTYNWTMNVTININQGGPNGNSTVDYGSTFTTTITANFLRNLPTQLTITMGGENLTANQYTYNTSSGRLTIPNVTGDLVITGETRGGGGCLLKGTRVTLADGTKKRIEDIQYTDLLLVWNYETGKVTKEYPIWIEKAKQTSQYTRITFSDNSTINVVKSHAFFSIDSQKFVDYQDHNQFHIGTTVLKISDNNQLEKVKVENIEVINETDWYYFIASTRYYNIISNDFITTDGYTDITNLYPFDQNIKWKEYNPVPIDYSYLEDVLPYYLFKGLRAEELGILLKYQITDLETFKRYITSLVMGSHMLQEPIMKEGNRYWMVGNSSESILIKEGSIYQLPEKEGIEYWYSTAENKKYKPGEKVQVWTGMYFEEIKLEK